MQKKAIICLFGPTATGKTDLAIELVQHFPLEIISVDSAMVYRGMTIGTAKPSDSQLALAPHALVDICDPAENYSAGQFCLDAHREMERIFSLGKIPLLVGGTMLYFRLLQQGFTGFPGANVQVREQIDKQAAQQGWDALHAQLAQHDPIAAQQIHVHDRQRIQRALEVFYATGKTITQWQSEQQFIDFPFTVINLALAPDDRALIHRRIAERFEKMLSAGLLEEAKLLYNRDDLTADMPSMRMVGYRQLWQYFAGEYTFQEMRERAIIATRQFAKRQYTWLNQWPNVPRFAHTQLDKISALLRSTICV